MFGRTAQDRHDATAPAGAAAPPRLFVSYAHADKSWLERLEIMLDPVLEASGWELWHDQLLQPGEPWNHQLEAAMDMSAAALVLVSAHSLVRESFVRSRELPYLMGLKIPITWILVGECAWSSVDDIASLQAVGPTDRALTSIAIHEADRRLVDISDDLSACFRRWMPNHEGEPLQPEPFARYAPPSIPLDSGSQEGPLLAVPALPERFVPRADLLESVVAHILGGAESAGIVGPSATSATSTPAVMSSRGHGVQGVGGIGKSVVAAMVCRDSRVRRAFPDGLVWISLGESPDLAEEASTVLAALGVDGTFNSLAEARQLLVRALKDRRCLIVVDDVWQAGHCRMFSGLSVGTRVLITSRDAQVLRDVGSTVTSIEQLGADEARRFLIVASDWETHRPPDLEDVDLDELTDLVGRSPLGLSVMGGALRGSRPDGWRSTLQRLRTASESFGDHPYANSFAAMRVAVAQLESTMASRYHQLGVFPEDERVDVETTSVVWGTNRIETARLLERLSPSLVDLHRTARGAVEAWSIHDVRRDFLLYDAPSIEVLHLDLVERYRAVCGDRSWADLAVTDAYVRRFLISHLLLAGLIGEAVAVATDVGWLIGRALLDGSLSTEQSTADIAALVREHRPQQGDALQEWARLFRQAKHLFEHSDNLDIENGIAGLVASSATSQQIIGRAADRGLVSGDTAASWRRIGPWPLADLTSAMLDVMPGHEGQVTDVGWHPQSQLLATGGVDATIRIWDVATGQETHQLPGPRRRVTRVEWSPDGSLIAATGEDRTTRIWDVATGRVVRRLSGHGFRVHDLAWHPASTHLATSRADGTVRVWNLASRGEIELAHQVGLSGVSWSPGGDRLATSSRTSVRIWDFARRDVVVELGSAHGSNVRWGPDDRHVAVCTGAQVEIWDCESTKLVTRLVGHTDSVLRVAWSRDGRRLATCGGDSTVRVWDAATGTQSHQFTGHAGPVNAVAWDPTGGVISSAGADGTTRTWDVATTAPTSTPTSGAPAGRIISLDWHLAAAGLVSVSSDGSIRRWDVDSGEQVQDLSFDRGSAAAWRPDGTALATGHADGVVSLWEGDPLEVRRNVRIGRLDHSGGSVRVADQQQGSESHEIDHLSWNHHGDLLAVTFKAGGMCILDPAEAGVRVPTLDRSDGERGLRSRVTRFRWAAHSNSLAIVDVDRDVSIWEADRGDRIRQVASYRGLLTAVDLSADGRLAAIGCNDHTARLLDVRDGSELAVLQGHQGRVTDVAWHRDGDHLATVSWDGTLRVWQTSTQQTKAIVRLTGQISGLRFDPTRPDVVAIFYGPHWALVQLDF